MAITGPGSNPSCRRHAQSSEMYSKQPHTHYYASKRNENPITYPATSHPRIRGVLPKLERFPEWSGSTYCSVGVFLLFARKARRSGKWTGRGVGCKELFLVVGVDITRKKKKAGRPLYPSGNQPQGRAAVNGPDWIGSPDLVFWENKHKLPYFRRTHLLSLLSSDVLLRNNTSTGCVK
ncbi:hypothetical protein AVEN_235334-1 [Araneus ventricosus]|uniref:Uncharacterized protein n=1 Tax=Araneus ventricosus TaxID=182803 RepID=A0A4Y2A3L3_ARAVE|nr:hypothetical protein AVEN_235334-1 [Araneus ventricosus]